MTGRSSIAHLGQESLVVREDVLGVGAAQHGVEDPAVALSVLEPYGGEIRFGVRERMRGDHVDRDPHVRAGDLAAQHFDCSTVGEEDMVGRGDRVAGARPAGSVLARAVPEPCDHPRLVLGDPARDPVAEPLGDDLDVLGERLDRLPDRPAAAVLERLRQVPVVQGRERLDAVLEQLVDEPVVEVEAGGVRGPASVGTTRGQAIENRYALRPSSRMSRMSSGTGGRSRTRFRRGRRSRWRPAW